MKRLAILGASGHGRVVADAALLAGWDEVIFFDDAFPKKQTTGGWQVLGNTDELVKLAGTIDGVVVAIGDNSTRVAKQREMVKAKIVIATVLHPAAVVSSRARLGLGSVVMAGAVVNPFATLGAACIVNTSASVDHDCVLGDGVHISPGARLGGTVRVGNESWIGIGAAVREGISIGANVRIGAGAAVVDDVPDGLTVGGVPARPLEKRSR